MNTVKNKYNFNEKKNIKKKSNMEGCVSLQGVHYYSLLFFITYCI